MVYIRSARTYVSKIKDLMYINANRVSRINRSTYRIVKMLICFNREKYCRGSW